MKETAPGDTVVRVVGFRDRGPRKDKTSGLDTIAGFSVAKV